MVRGGYLTGPAVGRQKGTIALLLCDESTNYGVAIYEGKDVELAKTVVVPAVHRIQFGWNDETLLVSYQLSGAVSTLGMLGWREGVLRTLGRYPGFDITRAHLSDPLGAGDDVLLTRHVSSDLWNDDGIHRQKLTTDGLSYSGDQSPSGELLVSKWNSDGSLNIWRQARDGKLEQLFFTAGPDDENGGLFGFLTAAGSPGHNKH